MAQSHPLEPPEAEAARPPARRSRHGSLAHRDVAGGQKGAEAQQQTIPFVDESGFYPLPSVVRTYAPVGQTPILRAWWTGEHLSAIWAMSPVGKVYVHGQDRALNSADVVAFREHSLREVPGRPVVIWEGTPMHRSHTIQEFLTSGASQRPHLAHLPAYPLALSPDEGVWAYVKGIALRNLCCFDVPHLRQELRDAVKRMRHRPRILTSRFQGAGL